MSCSTHISSSSFLLKISRQAGRVTNLVALQLTSKGLEDLGQTVRVLMLVLRNRWIVSNSSQRWLLLPMQTIRT